MFKKLAFVHVHVASVMAAIHGANPVLAANALWQETQRHVCLGQIAFFHLPY